MKVKWLIVGTLTLIFLIVITFCWLSFGDPQSSKWVYQFQANVYPGWSNGAVNVPNDYDGVWRDWDNDGNLRHEFEYNEGTPICFKYYSITG